MNIISIESRSPSRRFILTALSGAAVATIAPAAAGGLTAEPDPVFAALDACRSAYGELSRVCGIVEEFQTRKHKEAWTRAIAAAPPEVRENLLVHDFDHDDPAHLRLWQTYGYPELRRLSDTAEGREVDAIEDAAHCALSNAALDFAETIPTSIEGAITMLRSIDIRAAEGDDNFGGDYAGADESIEHMIMESVATYLERTAGRALT